MNHMWVDSRSCQDDSPALSREYFQDFNALISLGDSLTFHSLTDSFDKRKATNGPAACPQSKAHNIVPSLPQLVAMPCSLSNFSALPTRLTMSFANFLSR